MKKTCGFPQAFFTQRKEVIGKWWDEVDRLSLSKALESNGVLVKQYKANLLTTDVSGVKGAVGDVAELHFVYLSFVLSVFIISYSASFVNRFFNLF